MFVFIVCVIVLLILLGLFLRNFMIARRFNPQNSEEVVPDLERTEDVKFLQQNKQRRVRWKKKLETHYSNEERIDPKELKANYEKEVRYAKAKKALERKYPIMKRSVFDGSFSLSDMRKAKKERKVRLAELRKKIFEDDVPSNENGENSTRIPNPENANADGVNEPRVRVPEPILRKRKVRKEDLEEMPSN